MQDAREGAGEKASQVAKGMVRPAAWVIFAIGGVRFVLGGPGILRALVWFVLFGAPACLCFRYKKGRGITNVAVVFLLAAGFDAGFAVYNSYILQPRTDAMLRGLNPEAVGGDSLGEWSKQLKAAPQQPAADAPSKDALFYLNRAKTWMQKKEYDKAIEDFSESIRL